MESNRLSEHSGRKIEAHLEESCFSDYEYPKISIIIVNTNELHHLKNCLPSIFKQNYPNFEVLIIDNASVDGSISYIRDHFPHIKVIENDVNLGYAGANNRGFQHAGGDYIYVLNPDTIIDQNCLLELYLALEENRYAGLATPKILLMDKPQFINACGNNITFTGLAFCRGLEQPAERFQQLTTVSAVSGAAFLIRKDVLDKIGGFDEDFFLYYEETDLSLRALLAGYKCIYVPTAVIYHKYIFRFSSKKCFYQERNRYYSLIKNLRWKTLLILLPGLLFSEIISWSYSIIKGKEHISSKYRSYVWLVRNRQKILNSRKQTQLLRTASDLEIIKQFRYEQTFAQTTHPLIARFCELMINPIIFLLGKFSCMVVRW